MKAPKFWGCKAFSRVLWKKLRFFIIRKKLQKIWINGNAAAEIYPFPRASASASSGVYPSSPKITV